MISMSFLIMAAYYKIGNVYAFMKRHFRLKWFEEFYKFMTRFRQRSNVDMAMSRPMSEWEETDVAQRRSAG
jgi:hypothetical protein